MSALSITPANVLPTSDTVIVGTFAAGEAINAGQALYELTTTDGTPSTYKLATCNAALNHISSKFAGIAMNTAGTGQPVQCARGSITIGSGFTVGMQVNLGATAGNLNPVADIATTNNVVSAGCITGTGTTINVIPQHYGVLHV